MRSRRSNSFLKRLFGAVTLAALAASASAQQTSIINTKHNLSAWGPGTVRATSEQEVCIFCHTPHRATAVQPLWNRNLPVTAYRVYSSTTLQAKPGQPTGSSKLCLSCHDGTIALGSVASRDQTIGMAGGITTLPPGKTNLGTDLSDDHPISFVYDSMLVQKDPKIKDPSTLPPSVKLDKQLNLQCSTCHDAHDNSRGNFLVMDNSQSQLCKTCHKNADTQTIVGHTNCTGCHSIHTAPSGPKLLVGKTVTDTCHTCHAGQNNLAANLAPDLTKISVHDTKPVVDTPTVPNDTTCSNCHEPHTMTKATATAPGIRGNMGTITGVTAAGAATPAARYEYEVCFKCHGDQQPANFTMTVSRQIVQANLRLKFSTSAISFHPVEAAGQNTTVPSLRTGWNTSSIIYCSDCHNSDRSTVAGGSGPDGVHGSNYRPLLALNYTTVDGTSESSNAYALCYKCHDRNQFLADSGPFPLHKTHVVDQRTPCSICHDAHGIPSTQGTAAHNSRLINFDSKIVLPGSNGRLEYNFIAPGQGNCSLTCHSHDHNMSSYGGAGAAVPAARKRILRK